MGRRLEAVQIELTSLSPSLHSDFLLTQLHSAYSAEVEARHEAQHWRAVSEQQQRRTAEMAPKCQRMKQRLSRLLDDSAALKEDLRSLQVDLQGEGGAAVNGKEEKQPNGYSHPRAEAFSFASDGESAPSPALTLSAEAAGAASPFSDWSDFSSLLAATEAQLEVERRQRERTQSSTAASAPPHFPSTLSLSSPASSAYYHHDHSLTPAGRAVVHSVFRLFASAPTQALSLPQLQALAERVGRGVDGAVGGGAQDDDSGDVWWVWQSHASEDEAGGMGMTEEDLQSVYEQEWDLHEDAQQLQLQ